MQILIKTIEGLEDVLAQELEALQLLNIEKHLRAVSCEGNWTHLYKCNYLLRTAMRVLVPIKSATIETQDDLYEFAKSISWSQYIRKGKTFAINGTVSGDLFHHSKFAVYRTKDAIVDQLTQLHGERPSVNTKYPDLVIDLHISNKEVNISLDSTGRSLHLRNYKYRQYKAPLNEVLAAGILKLSSWDEKTAIHDPMSGSGTFTTEALMIAANIPAGMFNPHFAFQKWEEYYPEMWDMVKQAADKNIRYPEADISASDINPLAVRDTKKNLQKFPFKERVKIYNRDFFTIPGEAGKILFMNPPYNKRIEIDNIHAYYKNIGDTLKQRWMGSEAWIISGNAEAMKCLGLQTSKRIALNHGGTDVKLYNYKIYEGSKKSKYQ